jgi:sugar-specific transcriptional regulator TrmB
MGYLNKMKNQYEKSLNDLKERIDKMEKVINEASKPKPNQPTENKVKEEVNKVKEEIKNIEPDKK